MTDRIRIALVDDHPILRESLRHLLEKEEDMEVVTDAGDGLGAIDIVKKYNLDVIVMDIGMPHLNGIDAALEIASLPDAPRVVCLSIHRERGLVSAMLKAGASGYVLKSSAARELPAAVRAVARGETYLCPAVSADLVHQHVEETDPFCGEVFSELTSREREVLQLLAEGHHTKSVASALNISPKTVLVHRTNLMRKIGAETPVDLVRYAIRQGFTQL